jgi:ribosome-associated translation inhibitor RaiA
MQVQVSTDNNINGSAKLIENVSSDLQAALSRFGNQLTRIDVHLRDNNGPKSNGDDDKSCLLEARMAGQKPTVVSHEAATVRQAIDGATEKLERALDHLVGKLSDRKGRPTFADGDGAAG